VAVVLTPVEEMTTLVCLGLQKGVQINSGETFFYDLFCRGISLTSVLFTHIQSDAFSTSSV
jgi:hypothetical protein